MSDIAILGCGPAGLLACHAAVQKGGVNVKVYSKKEKSRLGGAQFLHDPVVGITDDKPDANINFVKLGTKKGYAEKVYGDEDAPTSWDSYGTGTHQAWNLQAAYDMLWELYEDYIEDLELDHETVGDLLWLNSRVFTTVPATAICGDNTHAFTKQDVWILNEPDGMALQDDEIVYNGYMDYKWYRASKIFGVASAEFSVEVEDAVHVRKPLRTNCNCYQSAGIIRIGRFGTWMKGVLVNDAYSTVKEVLDAMH